MAPSPGYAAYLLPSPRQMVRVSVTFPAGMAPKVRDHLAVSYASW